MGHKNYLTPATGCCRVELGDAFMEASVVDKAENQTDSSVTAGNQEIGGDYDFTENPWN